eukprot:PhM_4_TR9474/c0_g1_i1/m.12354/K03347/CUL1, CDC53; cullin 1
MSKLTCAERATIVESAIQSLLDDHEANAKRLNWPALYQHVHTLSKQGWDGSPLPNCVVLEERIAKFAPADFASLHIVQTHLRSVLRGHLVSNIAPLCTSLSLISAEWERYRFVVAKLFNIIYFALNATVTTHASHSSVGECQCVTWRCFEARSAETIAYWAWGEYLMNTCMPILKTDILGFIAAGRADGVSALVENIPRVLSAFELSRATEFYHTLCNVVFTDCTEHYRALVGGTLGENYKQWTEGLTDTATVLETYVRMLEERTTHEMSAARWSDDVVANKLRRIVLDECVVKQQKVLYELFEALFLVRTERNDDVLVRLGSMLVDALQPLVEQGGCKDLCAFLRTMVRNEVCTALEVIPSDADCQEPIISELATSWSRHTDVLAVRIFRSMPCVLAAVDDAYLAIFRENKFAGSNNEMECYVARQLHTQMREERDMKLIDVIISLVRYLAAKDVFCIMARSSLARRIAERCVDDDCERHAIACLLRVPGIEFAEVHRCRALFNDAESGRAMADKLCHEIEIANFSVTLASHAVWPLGSEPLRLTLPAVLSSTTERFSRHYRDKNPTRCLVWMWVLGGVLLTRDGITYDAEIPAASVLLALSDSENQSLPRDVLLGQLCSDEVARSRLQKVLDNLCRGAKATKGGLLRLTEDGNVVEINADYTLPPRMRRVMLRPKKAAVVPPAVNEVSEKRTYILRAAIVRVMKSVRECRHVDLVQTVISHVAQKFTPEVPLVKKAIERLIDEEYIERTEHGSYVYKA